MVRVLDPRQIAKAKSADVLAKALEAARDHLEYCGYGDSWERECAKEQKLEQKIKKALEQYEAAN